MATRKTRTLLPGFLLCCFQNFQLTPMSAIISVRWNKQKLYPVLYQTLSVRLYIIWFTLCTSYPILLLICTKCIVRKLLSSFA